MKALGGLALGVCLFGLAGAAQALDLETARAQGALCEGQDGLLRVLTDSPEIKALADATNARRLQIYRDSAQRQGVGVEQVQAVSGASLRQKHPACP